MRNRRFLLAVVVATLVLPAATAHAADSPSNVDPAEKFNRAGYGIHQFLDRYFIRPVALTYMKVVPGVVRDGLHHFLNNMGEPGIAANDILQGRFKNARTATLRFATNSTFGVLGVFDMAARAGLPRHENGFDVTLGRWGVKPGPYLFIPLVGPTTVRDAIGDGVNIVLDPVSSVIPRSARSFILGRMVVSGVDQRARVDGQLTALQSDATDPYATLRSVYLQNEQSKIDDSAAVVPALPDFDEDATPTAPTAPPAPETGLKPATPGAS